MDKGQQKMKHLVISTCGESANEKCFQSRFKKTDIEKQHFEYYDLVIWKILDPEILYQKVSY